MPALCKISHYIVLTALLCSIFSGCKSQPEFGTDFLHLEKIIPLPGVRGRIDHMAIDLKDQVIYVAALGNNTLEVISLLTGKVIHSIGGLSEPQGVCYIPQSREIIVANGGSGDCYFYSTVSFAKTASIHLSSDADNIRYDSLERKIYVGYGNGGIAIIDADSHRQVGNVVLPAHPEGFQLDKKLNRLFVNMPDANMIGVVDIKRMELKDQWKRNTPRANFPMAVDTVQHKVFIGYRHPARLVIFDGLSGKELGITAIVGDTDDIFYDKDQSNVLVSGGDGYINILHEEKQVSYQQIANIATKNGARTALLIPALKLFIVAAKAASGQPAALYVYKLKP